MTIKNRLNKLETTVAATDGHCQCFPMVRTESYRQDTPEDVPELITEAVPEVCPKCSKTTNKTVIILQFFDQTTEEISNQWSKNNEL